ncbi:MAG: hypothetical protein HY073_05045 [Deltaproteobacteria bacterium]|nr:hypothetical protein [Deltaproteobacteria bacterium]
MGGVSFQAYGKAGVRKQDKKTEGDFDLTIHVSENVRLGDSVELILNAGPTLGFTTSGTPRVGGEACVSGGFGMIGLFGGVCGGAVRNFDLGRNEIPLRAFVGGVAPMGSKALFAGITGGPADISNPSNLGFVGALVVGGSLSALFGK